MAAKYSLPFRAQPYIRRCAARSHQGRDGHCIDFYLRPGTPVLAARAGIVVHRESRWSRTFFTKKKNYSGNGVVLLHADGETSVYWHALWRSVRVALGQKVRRGQALFLSGQTGFATYPHLHFGVYTEAERSRIPDFSAPLPPRVAPGRYENKK